MSWPFTVRKSDLRIDYYRGSGKGGQKRNKTDSACRMVHIPTGEMASAEEHTTQHQNRRAAFKRLAAKLVPLMKPSPPTRERVTKTVRTYHALRRQVTDKRAQGESFQFHEVLDGNLDPIHKAIRKRALGEDV